MTDEADAIKETISGLVQYFTKKDATNYRIFWLKADIGKEGFCKGWLIKNRQIDVGYRLRLTGKFYTDPKYPKYGDQFFFCDYEIISTQDSSNVSYNADHFYQSTTTTPYEEVTGRVLKFNHHEGNSRIFRLRAIGGNEFYCVGYITPSKEIFENNKLHLSGTWERNPIYGLQFKYKNYEIISPDKPVKVIIRKKSSTTTDKNSEHNQLPAVISFLKDIGTKKITYEFHSPKHDTISRHVLQQLDERVIQSKADDKDFYFLTAFFDRNVPDRDVQLFRQRNHDFKEKLFRCWEEAKDELEIAVSDIGRALNDLKNMNDLCNKSNTFKNLLVEVPGTDGKNQLLACLKIIHEKYNRDQVYNIVNMASNMAAEKALKQYLIGIHGVKHKIANWTLTNVTGHWFVIDKPHIKPLIEKILSDTIPAGMEVSAENADAIFEHWFGKLNKINKVYERFSRKEFATTFPDLSVEACEYLPFIVTQYLWFYDMFYGEEKTA